MSKASILEYLLDNFMGEIPDLLAALIIDFNGFIIAKKSVKAFDDELIGGIISILEQNLSRIKQYTKTELSSGSIDISEFRLFYIELNKSTGAFFVLVGNPYSNLDKFIPYSYIVAEKISLILNNREVSLDIPRIGKDGNLMIKPNTKTLLIIGSEAVGKSTLVEMLNNRRFEEIYKPTIGISYSEKKMEEINLTLSIFDLGGLRSFAKVRRYYYQYSNIILIVFDYSRVETFNEIKNWIEESRQFIKEDKIPFVIIGSKADLVDNRDEIKNRAMTLASDYKFTFYETSALNGEGVNKVFNNIILKELDNYAEKIITKSMTQDLMKNLTDDERLIFLSKIDINSINDIEAPNFMEKHIIFNIAKHKEISLAVLLTELAPIEKGLNRKIDKETILKIIDKYVQKGQILKQFIKIENGFQSLIKSKNIQRGDT
ncbi:MAG: GTP-binding protein [Promethearchaeota archaeon]